MAETTSGPVNGKAHEPHLTGADLPVAFTRAVGGSPIKISEQFTPTTEEKIDVVELYKYYSPQSGGFQSDAPLAGIAARLEDTLVPLRAALGEEDELQRENHIAVMLGKLYGMAVLVGIYDNFDEAISAVLTAVDAHKTTVYARGEIVALQKVLEVLRRSPNPGDDDLTLIFETLGSAGFDLNSSLAGIDLSEDGEQEEL